MFKALKKKMKDQRGLTLIELLAVIVILGIIAAIAIPSIGNIISSTDKKATVSEGLQIISAAKLYVAEKAPATSVDVDETALAPYVDNVEGDFTVKITRDSNGKYSYALTEHASVALVDKDTSGAGKDVASESELLAYK
ncbi:prepilin-type N-terminal cleavage/methylation domain-containing protein [Mesobacillus sp. S13]|uniref:prepilin-type N-terminal cleavage/methylation domain-containing protein n=1 Tax=Mesobacillus sp. S13 TaxID=2880221 RepID=UPI001CF15A9A|nr:prepilin-type N-terminal cleavage/methylation domain-containing protein [Mesobacillus sp. S13]